MLGEGGGALQKLSEGVDAALAAAACLPVDDEAQLDFLTELRKQLNRGELAFAVVAGRYGDGLGRDDATSLSPIESLRFDCKMSSSAAAAAVNIGEHLERVPLSRAALEEGRIGFAHLNLIAYTAQFIGEGFKEAALLKKAEQKTVTVFARICRAARMQARPELCAQQERELHEARFLELSTRDEDGAVWFRGLLDAESGAYFRTAVEALAQPLPEETRTAGQRRADALTEISKLALDEGLAPRRGGVRPHVQVTMPVETWLGIPGAPAPELEGSGPISPETMRRICGDVSVRRLLLDGESLVIDVGRERRGFRGGSRQALEARDGGCVWPGCARKARFCQADHIEEFWKGGETNLANGRLLCRYHHRLRSEGWQLIRIDEDGEAKWLVTPPRWALYSRGAAS